MLARMVFGLIPVPCRIRRLASLPANPQNFFPRTPVLAMLRNLQTQILDCLLAIWSPWGPGKEVGF